MRSWINLVSLGSYPKTFEPAIVIEFPLSFRWGTGATR
jgi:hypothetical protein